MHKILLKIIHFPQPERISLDRRLARFAALLAVALISCFAASAQQTNATIVGNVTDNSGAVVVGAKVTATDAATNTARTTVTDSAGQYTLPALPVGTYSLSVEMSGFQSQRADSINLDASQTARQDFKMVIGQVSQTVAVEAGAATAQLQTENGAVGEVIDARKIVDLPLNGRNFVQLAQLIPGVNTGTEGSITVRRARGSVATTDPTGGTIAIQVNGQRDTQNLFSIDGTEAMDYDAWTYSFSPSVDAIAEFRVDTSTSGTDTGAAAGANVNIIIKSGTNNLHGTLWEFNRNNDFTQTYDAIAQTDVTPARLNRNQFGANIGGPVYIPHIYNGHDKTFFFFNWETGYQLNGANVQQAIVPDNSVRAGILDAAALTASNGKPLKVVDPVSGRQFQVGDHIAVDPRSAIMMAVTPAPNVTNTSSTTNYNTIPVNTLNYQYDYIGRMDHTIGRKDTVSGHYIYDQTYSNGPSFFGNDEDNNNALNHLFEVSEIHVFSPAIVNEFRYGRQNFQEFETFGTTNNPKYNIANGQLQIPFSSSDPHFYGAPNLTVSGPDGSYRLFADLRDIGPRNRANGINQFVDNLSYQHGRHFLKFGLNIGRRTDYFSQARDAHGHFSFTGQYTGSAMVDFLLGYIASDSINPTITRTNISSLIQAYSVQDNWSITRTLTVNLGFRWDHFAPYTQDDNKYADIYIAANGINPDRVVTPATSPYGRGLLQPTYHDFQPRLGFAYQPYGLGKVVVRGGYGIYFTPEIDNAPFTMGEGAQAQSGAQLTGNTGLTSPNPAQKLPNLLFGTNPFPGVTTGGPLTYPFDTAIYQHLQDQMTQEFNLTVQMQLPAKLTGEIAYVGARGTHNFISYSDINMPLPINPASTTLSINARRPNQTFLRPIQGDFSSGSSTYHSMQTKMERRVGQGLSALVSYTWSKSISGPGDIGGIVGGGNFGANPLNPYNPRADRSISLFDIPHRFVGTVLYDLPFFQNSSGFKKLLFDGVQVSTIVTAVSGDPSNVSYSGTSNTGTGQASRPDRVPGQVVSLGRGGRTPMRQFNTAAFTAPQPGEFGTSPRTGAVRLPGLFNDDFSATKGFKFGETRNLQIRADFFNAFKHYNPDPSTINTNITSQTYGRINNGLSGGYATRIIQLAAKLYF
ncbi:MAG TPA: carboxypeptidase regulatory-like domain-containing protein [Acidobacteriaceae bacterium]|nr:carboxypeptidase regulatory-like domain-containing protein [Acidobacteriaceae bacterium]